MPLRTGTAGEGRAWTSPFCPVMPSPWKIRAPEYHPRRPGRHDGCLPLSIPRPGPSHRENQHGGGQRSPGGHRRPARQVPRRPGVLLQKPGREFERACPSLTAHPFVGEWAPILPVGGTSPFGNPRMGRPRGWPCGGMFSREHASASRRQPLHPFAAESLKNRFPDCFPGIVTPC